MKEEMIMANAKFSKHAISTLKKNPYVEKVSDAKITYKQEFIDLVLERVKQGDNPIEVFEENGFSVRVLGKTRILGSVGLWKSRYDVVAGPRKPKPVTKPAKETAEQRRKRMLGSAILYCDNLMNTPEAIEDYDKATNDEEKRFVAIRQTYNDRKNTNKFVVKNLVEYYGLNYDKYFIFLRKVSASKEPEHVSLLKRRSK